MTIIKALLYLRHMGRLLTLVLCSAFIGAIASQILFSPAEAQNSPSLEVLAERTVNNTSAVKDLQAKVDSQESQISRMQGIGIGISSIVMIAQLMTFFSGKEIDRRAKEILEHGRK